MSKWSFWAIIVGGAGILFKSIDEAARVTGDGLRVLDDTSIIRSALSRAVQADIFSADAAITIFVVLFVLFWLGKSE